MIPENMKRTIDSMDYECMLRRWRFAKTGDSFFQGEVGQYFSEVMKKKRSELSNEECVAASKNVSWEG
jgi:hypothetical protein